MTVLPVQNLFYVPQPPLQTQIWRNAGWEIQPPPPPHRKPERFGGIVTDDDGSEGLLVRWLNVGWEIQPPPPPRPRLLSRTGAIMPDDDGSEGPFINWRNTGWEVQSVQPPHPRREKFGSIVPKDDGTEAAFVFVPLVSVLLPPIDYYSAWPRPPKRSTALGIDGTNLPFYAWRNAGWEIQSVQPYPLAKRRSVGAHGESSFAIFSTTPWHDNLAWQPYHVRYERAAAIMPIEPGIEAPFVAPPVITTWGFEPPPVIKRIRAEAWGALARGDDGSELPKINWQNAGWQIAEPPPPHKPIEKRGNILPKDDGNQLPFYRWRNTGWEIQPYQPGHPRPERFGSIVPKDDGIETPFVFVPLAFFTIAWAVQNFQPPHPRPERGAAIMPHDDGIENVFHFVPPTMVVRDPDIPHEVWRKYRQRLKELEVAQIARERAEERARSIKRKTLRDLVLGVTEQAHDALIAAEEANTDVGAVSLANNLNALANAKNYYQLERIALQTEGLVRAFNMYLKDMQDDEDDIEAILPEIF